MLRLTATLVVPLKFVQSPRAEHPRRIAASDMTPSPPPHHLVAALKPMINYRFHPLMLATLIIWEEIAF